MLLWIISSAGKPLHSSCTLMSRCCYRHVQTGTHLASFKDNSSGTNALCLLGQDYLVAAQAPKGALHFWTWHKVCAALQLLNG